MHDGHIEKYIEIYDEYILKEKKSAVAVAVKYDKEKDRAPVITAKGAEHMAMRIVEIARKNGVEIVSDESAAKTLMSLDVGFEIPYGLYKAMSVILAYVYSLKR